jgi:hypothetical protein
MSVSGGEGGGYTGALNGLAKSFQNKIKTNTPVVKIDQSGDVVEVYTTNGQVIYARSVIVTVPLGVLKKSDIEFVPPLNGAKLEAIDLIGMGNMNKVLMYWTGQRKIFRGGQKERLTCNSSRIRILTQKTGRIFIMIILMLEMRITMQ